MGRRTRLARPALVLAVGVSLVSAGGARAQAPEVVDHNLAVRTAASGLNQPIAMAFIGRDDFLVLEKASGRVLRVLDGGVQGAVLDLAVNSASERGLLGHRAASGLPRQPGVYLYWTESTTGADSTAARRRAAARQSRRPVRLERLDADARPQHHPAARVPGGRRPAAARQPQRRRARVRAGRQAVHRHRRQRPPRLDAEPACDRAVLSGRSADDQFGGPQPDNAH